MRLTTLLALLVIVAGGFFYLQNKDSANEQLTHYFDPPKAAAEPYYEEPKVGMSYAAFTKLCGSMTVDDLSRSNVSSWTRTVTYIYRFDKARTKTKCHGTFDFTDDKLVSISH